MSKSHTSYTLSSLAYTKLVLHCTKYAVLAVNGIVIGKIADTIKDKENSADEDASSTNVIIEDAIPLFHGTGVYLEPMTLIALQQVGHEPKVWTISEGMSVDWL